MTNGSDTPRRRVELTRLREAAGLTQAQLATALEVHIDTVRGWEAGRKDPYPGNLRRLADALGVPIEVVQAIFADPSELKGEGATNRRDALKLGAVATLTPRALAAVLGDAADDAASFIRRASTTAIGQPEVDHLKAAVADVSASYSTSSPHDLFPVARAYRQRVDDLLSGDHTLSQAIELYVCAGWLSETLAWLAHDLGRSDVASAYCGDAFAHAYEVGHGELCAWAMDARASVSLRAAQPHAALNAALRGIDVAPSGHPLAVRLQAQAARSFAHLGRADDFERMYQEAQDTYDRLPAAPPTRHGKSTAKLAAYAITSYAATSCLKLGKYELARQHAQAALSEHEQVPARDRSPSREAIARLDLAHALAGLGEPADAAQLAADALTSPRVVHSVLTRAGDLAETMGERYPELPATSAVREQVHAATAEQGPST